MLPAELRRGAIWPAVIDTAAWVEAATETAIRPAMILDFDI
jgi:hypothetical protein